MENMSFEKSLERLSEIVGNLESGECSLEDSFKLFEEGSALSKRCYETLENAKIKYSELTNE